MFNVGEIVQTVKSLIETRIDLVKNEIQDQMLGIVSRVVLLMIMGVMLLLVILVFSLALAFFLSTYLGSPFMGFLIVGFLYIVFLLILYLSRDSLSIQNKVQVGMKSFIFKKSEEKTEDDE